MRCSSILLGRIFLHCHTEHLSPVVTYSFQKSLNPRHLCSISYPQIKMTSATLCCLVLVACTTSFNALIHNPMSITRHTKLHAMEYPREGFFDPASKAQIPLKIAVAGGGVGGMFLGYALQKKGFEVTVYEKASAFSRFGGPIQLASNALSCVNSLSPDLFDEIMTRFTFTGTRKCGIKDGIRNTWYSVFEAITNLAEWNTLPYTGVIDRPDLQEILLDKVIQRTHHSNSTPHQLHNC